ELHGKTWAAECHTAWQQSHADQCTELIAAMAGRAQTDTNHPMQAEEDVPGSLPCRTRQEVLSYVESLWSQGWQGAFVKAELGWAGRGNRRLRKGDSPGARHKFEGWVERQLDLGPVLVEPEFNRVLDFSVQLEIGGSSTSRSVETKARHCFLTDGRGIYRGTALAEDRLLTAWSGILGAQRSPGASVADRE
ncbi:unnamed protein product, partial [Polarella glacialis]